MTEKKRASKRESPSSLPFPEGAEMRLCLDFVNTEGEVRNNPPDRLDTFELFAEWGSRHGLEDVGGIAPGAEDRFLVRARTLRETLYRIFAAVTGDTEPADDDLARLNGALADALGRVRLVAGRGGMAWALEEAPDGPDRALDLIALTAAQLLTSDRLGRVKECASETCGWMFIDESRNRSRRWCDMSDCGNREKARRFYHRHASGEPGDDPGDA